VIIVIINKSAGITLRVKLASFVLGLHRQNCALRVLSNDASAIRMMILPRLSHKADLPPIS
jgi:hypothetical protein